MADFGDTLAVFRVVSAPEVQRVDVEILPVEVDALFSEELVNMVGQPLPRRRITQVQQAGNSQ